MFAHAQDLHSLVGHAAAFEELLFDLVTVEAARHGIPPDAISRDTRTTVGDGGRDIVIHQEHTDAERFIPQQPSIWSAKSGKDGTQPKTLTAELNFRKHPKVRKHLAAGKPYVWCALYPATEDEREKMRKKVIALAAKPPQFDPNLVRFIWEDALCTILNDHLGVLVNHLPAVAARTQGFLSLREWERSRQGFDVEWVDFAGRSHVCEKIRRIFVGGQGLKFFMWPAFLESEKRGQFWRHVAVNRISVSFFITRATRTSLRTIASRNLRGQTMPLHCWFWTKRLLKQSAI